MNKKFSISYHRIPLSKKDWFNRYEALSLNEDHHVLLESGRAGRYSMIGLRPFAVVEGKGETLTITTNESRIQKNGPLLQTFNEWFDDYRSDTIEGLPDFTGGAIGYVSYDVVREIEHLPSLAKDDLFLPDLYFYIFQDVFVYEHETEQLWVIVNEWAERAEEAERRLENYLREWSSQNSDDNPIRKRDVKEPSEQLSVSMTETEFIEAVERVKQYIASGDVFQVNLSVRQSKPLAAEPFQVYKELRRINPSPYMGYLHAPDFQFVSGSPELLVKKKGGTISTRPIAGTRPRGRTEEEDLLLAQTLINNEKERAEHVMLVDLERNDLGKVSKYGSVQVDEFMIIERYSHVMHIVSNVRGELKENVNAFDCLKAAFPGGTITGAPKVRTMEIIEELEPVKRGIYTGSIGWIGFNGDMEMNIVIRTMVAKDGIAHVQAGAGIVIDSVPAAEYQESLKKAEVLWRAKEEAEKNPAAIML